MKGEQYVWKVNSTHVSSPVADPLSVLSSSSRSLVGAVREGVVVYVDWEEEDEVVSAVVKGDCEKRGRRTGACFMLDFSGV